MTSELATLLQRTETVYTTVNRPTTKQETLDLLQKTIQDIQETDEPVVPEIVTDDNHLIFFADENEEMTSFTPYSEATIPGSLISYGAFIYEVENHDVQEILEHKFEIRDTEDGLLVYIGTFQTPTRASWEKRHTLNRLS